jgi:CheY-like chemotaxis protein
MSPETVIVADDDPASRLVLCHALQASGFRVLYASDGREALALVTEHAAEVSMLLTDCFMPEIDGLELAQLVRDRFTRKIPVIMITSLEYQLPPETLAKAGVDCVIGKPFSPKAICRLVREVLDNRLKQNASAG